MLVIAIGYWGSNGDLNLRWIQTKNRSDCESAVTGIWASCRLLVGVSNGPIQFESARKIWPLLKLLAKIRWVLACSCSQNFCSCSHARIFVKTPYRVTYKRNLHLRNKNWHWKQCFPRGKLGNIVEHACAMNVSGKCFLVLLTFIETDQREFSSR